MAIRKVNKDLIVSIETDRKKCKYTDLSSEHQMTKDDYLSISEWLFKTYSSIKIIYNGNIVSVTIGF